MYNIASSYDKVASYEKEIQQDMLVSNDQFGFDLANCFSNRGSWSCDHNVVLMTNHGFTAVGFGEGVQQGIKQAVYRAVYTCVNADVQTKALMISPTGIGKNSSDGDLTYLSKKQTLGCQKMNDTTMERPWGLWRREVEVCPLYRNEETASEGAESR